MIQSLLIAKKKTKKQKKQPYKVPLNPVNPDAPSSYSPFFPFQSKFLKRTVCTHPSSTLIHVPHSSMFHTHSTLCQPTFHLGLGPHSHGSRAICSLFSPDVSAAFQAFLSAPWKPTCTSWGHHPSPPPSGRWPSFSLTHPLSPGDPTQS